jgi:hypothetical protein
MHFSKKQYRALALIPVKKTENHSKPYKVTYQNVEEIQRDEIKQIVKKEELIETKEEEEERENLIRYFPDNTKRTDLSRKTLIDKQKIPLGFSAKNTQTIDWFPIVFAIVIIGIMALLAFTNFSSTAWVIILIFVILVLLILIFLIFNMIFGGIFGFMSEIF